MKKLMILASAAVFGLSLHAANVNWLVDLDSDAYDETHTFMFASGTQLATLVGYLEAEIRLILPPKSAKSPTRRLMSLRSMIGVLPQTS